LHGRFIASGVKGRQVELGADLSRDPLIMIVLYFSALRNKFFEGFRKSELTRSAFRALVKPFTTC
jgi:hypothetical protein